MLSRWLPPIIWAALIFVLSSIPDMAPPEVMQFRFWDKVAHTAVYAVLGALICRAWGTPRNVIWGFLIGTLYGASDELHQYFVPGRFSQFSDMAADAIGSLAGSWIWSKAGKLRSKSV